MSLPTRAVAAAAPPFTPRELALLVFDLDGTLIDSKEDLVASVNAMLRHLHRPELPAPAIASYVGHGAPALVRRALAATAGGEEPAEDELAAGLEQLLRFYDRHKLDTTRLYPQVRELLPRLAARFRLAVLSNKPVRPAREILAGLGVERLFAAIYGGNSFAAKKPDPAGLLAILAEAGAGPRAALMIGDSEVDILTGRNAGAWTCGVGYGFNARELAAAAPDWRVESFGHLTALLA